MQRGREKSTQAEVGEQQGLVRPSERPAAGAKGVRGEQGKVRPLQDRWPVSSRQCQDCGLILGR